MNDSSMEVRDHGQRMGSAPVLACLLLLATGLWPSMGRPAPVLADSPDQATATPDPGNTPPPSATSAPTSTLAPTLPPPPTETPYQPSATAQPTAPAPTATPIATAASSITAEPEQPVLRNEERPLIVLDRYDVEPNAPQPGQQFRLRLHLVNEGEHFAENLRVTLTSPTFLPVNQGAVRYENNIDEGDRVAIEVDMRVITEAKSGIYPLSVSLRWDDSHGTSYSDESSIGIGVGDGAALRPVLGVISTRMPARVVPDLPFNLVLELFNSGGREARNVVVAPSAGPLALQGGSARPLVLAPGASASLSLRMIAAASGEPGAVAQALEIRYDDPEGERFTEAYSVGLVITGKDASGPLPMVTGYRTTVAGKEGAALNPGATFELEIEVQNVGRQAAENARMTLGSGGGAGGAAGGLGVFAPLGTSNLRFLDRLEAGESRKLVQKMVIDGAAKPGVYVVEVGFDYVDANGKAVQSSEVISLLISRRVMLEINPLELPDSAMAGMPLRFTADLVNQGTSTVNVANARIEAEGAISLMSPVTEFVGALDAAGFFGLQAELMADEAGKGKILVTIEYFDDFNELREIERSYPVTVEAAPEIDEGEGEGLDAGGRRSGGNIVLRAIKGFLGLGASPPLAPVMPPPMQGGFDGGFDGSFESGPEGGPPPGVEIETAP
jgi:hypothetical protein